MELAPSLKSRQNNDRNLYSLHARAAFHALAEQAVLHDNAQLVPLHG